MKDGTCEIHLVTMVRNEADILPAFLARATALFDKVFVVDHQSTDGTRAMLERAAEDCDRIEIFDFRYQGYYQREVSNLLARHAIREGADWVFFLDADEFLDVENREALRASVRAFPHEIMHLRWMNLVPHSQGSFTSFDADQPFQWDGWLSKYGKIAIKATFAALHPHFFVHQGNHSVSATPAGKPAAMQDGLSILHVPIRSLDRLRYKLAAGMRAYKARSECNPTDGFHWFELHDRLEQGTATPEWINGVIAHYGEPLGGIKPIDGADKRWVEKRIPGDSGSPLPALAAPLAVTIDADARQPWKGLVSVDGAFLRADLADREVSLWPQPMCWDGVPYEGRFATLPPEERRSPDAYDNSQIAEALSRAFMPIKTVVPSAWTEHTPLLFALFSLLRPRRYVEIGTHFGMSFFGAGQAAEHLETGTQCVAIDGWIGDEHAGFYDNETFKHFKANLASLRYRNSYYIRSFFEQSLSCFEAGSIDLLHIDGLHTYEAVKKDYETWLPKMSPRGVILFHDTNVYERGFGVWRLWNELKAKHPHFQLPHCHGLGVIYVGDEPSPFAALLRRLETDEALMTAAISIFAGVGAMSIKRTTLEQDLLCARTELDDLREVRAENVQLKAAMGAVWATTSWRVTKPVRIVGDTMKSMRRTIRGRS